MGNKGVACSFSFRDLCGSWMGYALKEKIYKAVALTAIVMGIITIIGIHLLDDDTWPILVWANIVVGVNCLAVMIIISRMKSN